jgi:hypothetical protein
MVKPPLRTKSIGTQGERRRVRATGNGGADEPANARSGSVASAPDYFCLRVPVLDIPSLVRNHTQIHSEREEQVLPRLVEL